MTMCYIHLLFTYLLTLLTCFSDTHVAGKSACQALGSAKSFREVVENFGDGWLRLGT